jgi:hypothetical protein
MQHQKPNPHTAQQSSEHTNSAVAAPRIPHNSPMLAKQDYLAYASPAHQSQTITETISHHLLHRPSTQMHLDLAAALMVHWLPQITPLRRGLQILTTDLESE